MKRPMLISGITVVIVSALLIFLKSGAIVVPVSMASVLFLYLLFRKNLKNHIIIPTVCIISLLMVLSFFAYNKINISPYIGYHKTNQDISGKVVSTPQYVANYILFTLETDKIGNNTQTTKIHIISQNNFQQDIELFDYISLPKAYITMPTDDYGSFDVIEISDNILLTAECSDYEILWESQKTIPYYCLKLRELVSEQIYAFMTGNNGALLKGMLFGEKADLDYTTAQSFRNCGISHLLAVSGLHTSLWCGLLISILSAFKINKKAINIVCIIFLSLFCTISGFTPSVVRSAFMTAVTLLSLFFKRTPDSINSLGLAVFLLLLANPYMLLSISFQLSVLATLGVLVANLAMPRLQKTINKIKSARLKTLATSVIATFVISIFAGLFTLPACAYYFETFSILSPISNLLCVQLAFYGMMAGTISVAISFINIPFIKTICLAGFHVTEFILDLVKELAAFASKFNFATIPVHREYAHIGLLVAFILFVTGYIVYKSKKRSGVLKITVIACISAIFVSILVPIVSLQHRNTITIARCEKGIQLIVRSGLNYAYIENTTSQLSATSINSLPKATCEKLQYYFPSYLSKKSIDNISTIELQYKPTLSVIPPDILNLAKYNNKEIPENTIADTQGTFILSDEISIEIVDTNAIKYAIIKGKEKSAFIHLYGDTQTTDYLSLADFNIAVYTDKIPKNIPQNIETAVISISDYDPVLLNSAQNGTTKLYTTAKHGSIEINL